MQINKWLPNLSYNKLFVAYISLIFSKFTNWVLGKFCGGVGNNCMILHTKNCSHQMHKYQEIRKIVLGDGGRFLQKI
jgi:hypothetical protein